MPSSIKQVDHDIQLPSLVYGRTEDQNKSADVGEQHRQRIKQVYGFDLQPKHKDLPPGVPKQVTVTNQSAQVDIASSVVSGSAKTIPSVMPEAVYDLQRRSTVKIPHAERVLPLGSLQKRKESGPNSDLSVRSSKRKPNPVPPIILNKATTVEHSGREKNILIQSSELILSKPSSIGDVMKENPRRPIQLLHPQEQPNSIFAGDSHFNKISDTNPNRTYQKQFALNLQHLKNYHHHHNGDASQKQAEYRFLSSHKHHHDSTKAGSSKVVSTGKGLNRQMTTLQPSAQQSGGNFFKSRYNIRNIDSSKHIDSGHYNSTELISNRRTTFKEESHLKSFHDVRLKDPKQDYALNRKSPGDERHKIDLSRNFHSNSMLLKQSSAKRNMGQIQALLDSHTAMLKEYKFSKDFKESSYYRKRTTFNNSTKAMRAHNESVLSKKKPNARAILDNSTITHQVPTELSTHQVQQQHNLSVQSLYSQDSMTRPSQQNNSVHERNTSKPKKIGQRNRKSIAQETDYRITSNLTKSIATELSSKVIEVDNLDGKKDLPYYGGATISQKKGRLPPEFQTLNLPSVLTQGSQDSIFTNTKPSVAILQGRKDPRFADTQTILAEKKARHKISNIKIKKRSTSKSPKSIKKRSSPHQQSASSKQQVYKKKLSLAQPTNLPKHQQLLRARTMMQKPPEIDLGEFEEDEQDTLCFTEEPTIQKKKLKKLDKEVSNLLKHLTEKELEMKREKNTSENLQKIKKESEVMFEKTKQDVKILAFELNTIVPSMTGKEQGFAHLKNLLQFGPAAGEPKNYDDPFHLRLSKHDDFNMVDIFQEGKRFFTRIEIGEKNLPGYFHLYSKSGGPQQYDFDRAIPEDLKVCISQNCREPTEEECDKCLKQFDILQMNQEGKRYFKFGSRLSREVAKYRDRIYISFETAKKPVTLYFKYKLAKSNEEKQAELQEKVEQFKKYLLENKKRIRLSDLTPRARYQIMEQIDFELNQFLAKNDAQERAAAAGRNSQSPEGKTVQKVTFYNSNNRLPQSPQYRKSKDQEIMETQIRKHVIEQFSREKKQKWLVKWDVFRAEKNKYLDQVAAILKKRNFVRRWISLIALSQVLPHLVANYRFWHEQNKIKLARCFLALKMKVRFRMRFERKYGSDQNRRFQRTIQRVIVFQGDTILKSGLESKATKIAGKFILKSLTTAIFQTHLFAYHYKIAKIQKMYKHISIGRYIRMQYYFRIVKRELRMLLKLYSQKSILFVNKDKAYTAAVAKRLAQLDLLGADSRRGSASSSIDDTVERSSSTNSPEPRVNYKEKLDVVLLNFHTRLYALHMCKYYLIQWLRADQELQKIESDPDSARRQQEFFSMASVLERQKTIAQEKMQVHLKDLEAGEKYFNHSSCKIVDSDETWVKSRKKIEIPGGEEKKKKQRASVIKQQMKLAQLAKTSKPPSKGTSTEEAYAKWASSITLLIKIVKQILKKKYDEKTEDLIKQLGYFYTAEDADVIWVDPSVMIVAPPVEATVAANGGDTLSQATPSVAESAAVGIAISAQGGSPMKRIEEDIRDLTLSPRDQNQLQMPPPGIHLQVPRQSVVQNPSKLNLILEGQSTTSEATQEIQFTKSQSVAVPISYQSPDRSQQSKRGTTKKKKAKKVEDPPFIKVLRNLKKLEIVQKQEQLFPKTFYLREIHKVIFRTAEMQTAVQ